MAKTQESLNAAMADLDLNVSEEEIKLALQTWNDLKDSSSLLTCKEISYPILPKKEIKNILITSALPYVNNVPHLGNLIGCSLSGDIFAKYCRMKGYNTLYLCGTDEYGTTTETKALQENLTCEEICVKYFKEHKKIYDWFNIEFDFFGRTSTSYQTAIAQDIFNRLNQNGFIFPDSVEQLYCEKCAKFLADRFVEGTCPIKSCGYNDARGDQCDKCGQLINAIELVDPKCKMCSTKPIIKSSQHLFLDLPKLTPKLEEWANKTIDVGNWTHTASSITKTWLREGLKPRCITRDLKWGTPVPLKGFEDKVFYVWFDAPIGYLSIAANYSSEWKQWFQSPDTVDYYQFMAKDNVPFHSVIFPSCLLGTGENYTCVNHLSGIEYLNYEDCKFSKSRGTGVFGDQARTIGLDSDIFRFYLTYIRPESQDSTFSWVDLMTKNNSELLNNLGNFINRALAFCEKNMNATVPAIKLTDEEGKVIARINQELKEYEENLDKAKLRDGIRNILNVSRIGNQYMQNQKPWALIKGTDEEKVQGETCIGICVNITYLLSVLVYPYMPNVSNTIRRQLNVVEFQLAHVIETAESIDGQNIKPCVYSFPQFMNKFQYIIREGHKIGKAEPLFKRIMESDAKEWKVRFGGVPQVDEAAEKKKKDKEREKERKLQRKKEKAAAATAATEASETAAVADSTDSTPNATA